MAFELQQVVPWGRSFDEYRRMFALTPADLQLRMLGCADGPANFNAEASRRGYSVISCDPLYAFSRDQIAARIDQTSPTVLEQARQNAHHFVWDDIGSVDELGQRRLGAMSDFLGDYEVGLQDGRYVDASLPLLPWADATFDLALCSHFLFLYSQHLSLDFHTAAVWELLRVAREVRIFPLVGLDHATSPWLGPIVDRCRGEGIRAEMERVPYEFQRGGNQMLRLGRLG